MWKDLNNPVSMLKYPLPRSERRLPVCPAMVSWKALKAAFGSSQRLAVPAPEIAFALCALTISGRGWPLGVAYALSCQLVAQRDPSPTLNGRPEVIRQVPLSSQPPMNASTIRLTLE